MTPTPSTQPSIQDFFDIAVATIREMPPEKAESLKCLDLTAIPSEGEPKTMSLPIGSIAYYAACRIQELEIMLALRDKTEGLTSSSN